jgi:hypothetical protein
VDDARRRRVQLPMRAMFLLPLVLLFAAPLHAALSVQVAPPSPTGVDEVKLLLDAGSDCVPGIFVTPTHNAFRLDLVGGCVPIPQPPSPVTLGRLAPGTYAYVVYKWGELAASGSFIVAPPAPTLSRWALLALGALLPAIGWIVIRR